MDILERLDPVLDTLAGLEPLLAATRSWLAQAGGWLAEGGGALLAVELPVPDLALVGAFGLAVAATVLSQRGRGEAVRGEVEELYRAELLCANRRAQQARGELGRAKQAIERERQKRRREADDARPAARLKERPAPQPPAQARLAVGA